MPYLEIVWVLLCSALVFIMQAGFAMLETGLTRAKKRRQYHYEKSDGLLSGFAAFLGDRLRTDVRKLGRRIYRKTRISLL